jgi:hypothetical protein
MYSRFRGSVHWVLDRLHPDSALGSSKIILDTYRDVVLSGGSSSSRTELAWAEYELRRRVHFALELLLSGFSQTLNELDAASLGQVLNEWETSGELPQLFDDIIALANVDFAASATDVFASIRDDAFLGNGPNQSQANSLAPASRATYAMTLLVATFRQTRKVRESGKIPDRNHYLERVFRILETDNSTTWKLLLHQAVESGAIAPHLQTTLRKMSQGQKCSLRFFPDGTEFQPTGTATGAGFSNTRLGNVLGFLSDIGFAQRASNTTFVITDDGRALVNELADSAR